MELKKITLAMMAATSVILTGCGSDDDNNDSNKGNAGSQSFVTCNESTKVCILDGVIDQDYTLDSDYEYVLGGVVEVGDGNETIASVDDVMHVTLTIPAGTHVKANADGTLIVTRGSKIMAQGTAAEPITFSSRQDEDFSGYGEWGGVVIQGFAPHYAKNNGGACYGSGTICNVNGEGGTGKFGGNVPGDNSGVMSYVRIAEAGKVVGADDEINGLTLMGVGHGTSLSYIQVHSNLDDGIEWFGGTVNLKYAVLTGNDDDDIDFDEGYQGNIQHVLIRKNPNKANASGSNDPRGLELNSDKTADSKSAQVSQTNGAVANVTVIGSPLVNNAGNSKGAQPGIRTRGEVTALLAKIAVTGYNECYQAKDGQDNTVTVQDVICDGAIINTHNAPETGTIAATAADIAFDQYWAITNAEASANTITADVTAVNNGSNFTFEPTSYIGAVKPNSAEADRWWAGWVIPGSLSTVASEVEAAYGENENAVAAVR